MDNEEIKQMVGTFHNDCSLELSRHDLVLRGYHDGTYVSLFTKKNPCKDDIIPWVEWHGNRWGPIFPKPEMKSYRCCGCKEGLIYHCNFCHNCGGEIEWALDQKLYDSYVVNEEFPWLVQLTNKEEFEDTARDNGYSFVWKDYEIIMYQHRQISADLNCDFRLTIAKCGKIIYEYKTKLNENEWGFHIGDCDTWAFVDLREKPKFVFYSDCDCPCVLVVK